MPVPSLDHGAFAPPRRALLDHQLRLAPATPWARSVPYDNDRDDTDDDTGDTNEKKEGEKDRREEKKESAAAATPRCSALTT